MVQSAQPRIWIEAGVSLVALCFVLYGRASTPERPLPAAADAGYFSSALREARAIEQVVINGVRYEVRMGEVAREGRPIENREIEAEALRVSYALAVARRAPILALEGVDLASFRQNTDRLSSLARSLADMQATPAESRMVARGLFPLGFLERLRHLEERRRLFLREGTGESAVAYEEALEEAFSAYRADLQEFKDAFAAAVPEDVPEYQILKGIIRREGFMASIERLEHGIASLQKEAERRRRCLRGGIIVCDTHGIRLAAEPLKKSFLEPSAAATEEILSLYDRASLGLQKPAVLLADSACVPSPMAPPLYTLRQEQDDLLLFVGDAFFVDTNRGATAPFYRFFRDIGLPYWPYPPASTYVCPSIAEEYGRVWSAYLVRDASQFLPLSSYASGEHKNRLAELESNLISSKRVLREADAREYVASGIAWAVYSPTVPLEALRHIESVALSLTSPGAGLAGSLRHLISELSSNMGLLREGVPVVLDARNLFYLRSGYFALFAGHAVSPDGANMEKEAGYSDIPLENLAGLRSKVSLDALAEQVEYFFAIHRQPDLLPILKP